MNRKKMVESDLEGGLVVLRMLEERRWSGKNRIELQERLWSGIRFPKDKAERATKLLEEYDSVRISESIIVKRLVELLPDSRRCCLSMNGAEIKVMLYFKGKYWDVEKFAMEAEREQRTRMKYPYVTYGKVSGHKAEYAVWERMCDEVWAKMAKEAAKAIRNETCSVWNVKLKASAYLI